MTAMTTRSTRRPWLGALLALIVPVGYLALGLFVDHGILPYGAVRPLLDPLGTIALSEVVLGPVGIVILGKAIGVREPLTWVALMVCLVPVLAVVWFLGVATLSGALGNPF